MKKLSRVPMNEFERALRFNLRDYTPVQPPSAYLKQFLSVARQYGYATEDDSWGELEKELSIVFRRLEQYRRALKRIAFIKAFNGANMNPDALFDELIKQGESFWCLVLRMEISVSGVYTNCKRIIDVPSFSDFIDD